LVSVSFLIVSPKFLHFRFPVGKYVNSGGVQRGGVLVLSENATSRAVHIKTIQRPFDVDYSRTGLAAASRRIRSSVCKVCGAFEYKVSDPDVVREITMSAA